MQTFMHSLGFSTPSYPSHTRSAPTVLPLLDCYTSKPSHNPLNKISVNLAHAFHFLPDKHLAMCCLFSLPMCPHDRNTLSPTLLPNLSQKREKTVNQRRFIFKKIHEAQLFFFCIWSPPCVDRPCIPPPGGACDAGDWGGRADALRQEPRDRLQPTAQRHRSCRQTHAEDQVGLRYARR